MKKISLILFISFLLSCSSVEVKNSNHTYVHKSGKFIFPVLLGNLQRNEIKKFDNSGADVGISYSANEKLSLVTTIYVYPTPKNENGERYTLIEHFEGIDQAILSSSPNSRKVKWPDNLPVWSDEGVLGILQAYDLGGSDEVTSLLQIYDYGDWALKFRSTYKASEREKAIEKINALHKEFEWPK